MIEAMQRTATPETGTVGQGGVRPVRDPAEWGSRLDGLIAMLSHDLRTPLSAISGWIFLLESGKLDADGQKRAIAKIKASVDEQVQLIDDTLTISRGETGRVELDRAPVSIGAIVSTAVGNLRPQATAKGLEIEGLAADLDIAIEADAAQLQRAIELLLAHALKSTPSGGQISVAARATPNRVQVVLSDTGNGIAAADLPFVLDPFRRSGGLARRAHGVERGLLLAQVLIAAHGGALSLASDGPGAGEAFTIDLPRAAGQPPASTHE